MVQLVIPFTRGGVSCLTPKQVEDLVTVSAPHTCSKGEATVFSYSVFDAMSATKACDSLKQSYASFCGYKDAARFKTIMTVRQSTVGPHNAGPSTENAVVGESDAGRVVLDMKLLVKSVEALKPTYCLPIYAPSALEDPPSKKTRTAGARTAKWFEASKGIKALETITAVPGSIVAEAKVEDLAKSPLVFLDAAGQGESLGARTAAMSRMVSSTAAEENSSDNANAAQQMKSFAIAESVPAILFAALAGVSMVECDYGAACARRGQAIDLSSLLALLKGGAAAASLHPSVMDMNDQKHQLDMTLFTEGCPCYTCRRHTKAYVYHLLSVQEMNAETLLTIHNTSQILQLCDALSALTGVAEGRARIQKALDLLAL